MKELTHLLTTKTEVVQESQFNKIIKYIRDIIIIIMFKLFILVLVNWIPYLYGISNFFFAE